MTIMLPPGWCACDSSAIAAYRFDAERELLAVAYVGGDTAYERVRERAASTAGQGLEPQLPEPESGVLPITPPGNGSAVEYTSSNPGPVGPSVLPRRYAQRYIGGGGARPNG